MESGFAASSTQKHKKLKVTEGEEDTISSKLPEPLISHILSFLSTEDAICTSVLSKRWINRWTFITSLNLNDSMLNRKRKTVSKVHFVNFVNRVLLLTQGSIMENISLLIYSEYDVFLLNTWISSILIRRVKNLRIFIDSEFLFSRFTFHLLFNTQNYLEELVLELCYSIKVPLCGFVYFSSLKLLKLCQIIFTFDSSFDLKLPNLRKLETYNCFWVSACEGSVTIDALLLETILIEHDCEYGDDSYPGSCTINFTGSQMKEITYRGSGDGVSPPIILPAPSSARNAFANIILFEYDEHSVPENESRAFMLLKQLSQVKSLNFDGLEVLSQPNLLPVFSMLCHLELRYVTCEILLGLLQRSPLLNTLILNEEIYKFDKELLNLCVVPECLIHTLKIVKFKEVKEYEHELYLAKLFLESGMVLETMSLSFDKFSWLYTEFTVVEEFKEKLLSFKKGCSSATIEFLGYRRK